MSIIVHLVNFSLSMAMVTFHDLRDACLQEIFKVKNEVTFSLFIHYCI